jgi:putative MATE family efflux protein
MAIPLYESVLSSMRDKISSRDWVAGDLIPREVDLCKQYGVSRSTIRMAMSRLVEEGLLTRVKGVGTYVSSEVHLQDTTLFINSFAQDLEKRGLIPCTELLSFRTVPAIPEINEKLALEYGMTYLRIILLDLPAFMILQVYASTMRECGETVVPMKAGAAAVAVNLIFNYLLIYGKFGFPRLGVAGAAVATVLSRYTETAIVVIWAHTHEKENTYMTGLYKTLSVPRDHVKKYFIKGTPLLLNEALWSFGMAVLAQNYSVRGLTVIAAMNIANTINNLFSVVFAAMGESVAIIVGQALGFGDMKRAREIDNKMIVSCVLISFAVSVFMFLFAPFFPRIYNTTEAVRKAAMGLVLAQAVFIPQNAFLNAAYFTLRAGGKTGVTFFFDCVFLWCVNIPIVFVLCRYTGLAPWAVYSAMQIGEWLKCIAGAVMVKKGVWLENLTGKGEDEKYLLRENEEKH